MKMIYEEKKMCLSRLRDVEIEIQIFNKKKRLYEKDIDYLKKPYFHPEAPKKPIVNILEVFEEVALVFCIFSILFLCALSSGRMLVVLCICVVAFGAYIFYVFLHNKKGWDIYRRELRGYNEQRRKNEERLKADRLVADVKAEELKVIREELDKLLKEREWLYEESAIPVEYRNIRCVLYIYDKAINEKYGLEKAIESIKAEELSVLVEMYDEKAEAECLSFMKM